MVQSHISLHLGVKYLTYMLERLSYVS
uniref:Uncharacterized protein n=1 Tax=Triticum urartu TaxID=4572 RepID=A0A8R7U193_TRIUA